jgi:hypothetical protein
MTRSNSVHTQVQTNFAHGTLFGWVINHRMSWRADLSNSYIHKHMLAAHVLHSQSVDIADQQYTCSDWNVPVFGNPNFPRPGGELA